MNIETGASAPDKKTRSLPNSLPRPPDELERLAAVWKAPSGWRMLSAVNNTYIGILYIATALLFLVLGGVLALVMRTQLAVADNDLVVTTPITSCSRCTARS